MQPLVSKHKRVKEQGINKQLLEENSNFYASNKQISAGGFLISVFHLGKHPHRCSLLVCGVLAMWNHRLYYTSSGFAEKLSATSNASHFNSANVALCQSACVLSKACFGLPRKRLFKC